MLYTYPITKFPEGGMQADLPDSVGLSSSRLERLNVVLQQYMPPFTIPIVEDFAQLVYQALE
jgi:hypothetical protein